MQLQYKNKKNSKTSMMNQVTLTANEQPDSQTKTTERTYQDQMAIMKEPIRRSERLYYNKRTRRVQETLTSNEDSKHRVESSNKNNISPENN